MSPSDAAHVEHLLELRRWDEAARRLAPLVAEEPHDAHLLGLQAKVLLGQGHLDDALEATARAIAVDPDDEWGHRLRSVVLQRQGRHQVAAQAAWRAVELAPSNWLAHAQYSYVAAHPYHGRPTAWDAALRAVELAPQEPDAHFAVGLAAADRQDEDSAVAAYRRVLALDPTHAAALNNLTVLESRLNLARSARGIAAALRLDPQDPNLHANVDWVVARFLVHVYSAAVAALVLGVAASLEGPGPADRSPATVAVAALLLAVIVGYAVLVWRSVPSGMRRYALTRVRRSGGLIYLVVVALIVIGAVGWVCVVPGGALDGTGLLRTVGIGAVITLVVHVSSGRR